MQGSFSRKELGLSTLASEVANQDGCHRDRNSFFVWTTTRYFLQLYFNVYVTVYFVVLYYILIGYAG